MAAWALAWRGGLPSWVTKVKKDGYGDVVRQRRTAVTNSRSDAVRRGSAKAARAEEGRVWKVHHDVTLTRRFETTCETHA